MAGPWEKYQQQGSPLPSPPPDPLKVRAQQMDEERAAITRKEADRDEREWNATHEPDGTPKPKIKQIQAEATAQQMGVARQKLESLRAIKSALRRVEDANDEMEAEGFMGIDKGWSGPILGYIPGGFDAESGVFDKNVAALAPLVRQLTRTPGEGAQSDYEARLVAAALPSRTDNSAARKAAIANIRQLVNDMEQSYRALLSEVVKKGPASSNNTSGDDALIRKYLD